MKRKRVSTENASSHSYKKSRSSYNIEELESRYPPQVFDTANSVPFEKSFDDDPSALLQYVYQKQQVPTNGTKRHHKQHHEDLESPMDGSRSNSNKHNSHDFRGANPREAGEGSFSDVNALGSYRHQEPREGYRLLEEPVALIDTFPRKKQKQIYGIIGGLESGLRSSRQQIENLEMQLDTLKSILGLDADEDGYTR